MKEGERMEMKLKKGMFGSLSMGLQID